MESISVQHVAMGAIDLAETRSTEFQAVILIDNEDGRMVRILYYVIIFMLNNLMLNFYKFSIH